MRPMKLPFVDLKSQFAALEPDIRAAIDGVLAHGQFIMGPEVEQMEAGARRVYAARAIASPSPAGPRRC